MRRTVGVAPGTTTMQIAGLAGMRLINPYQADFMNLRGVDTRAKIRWDLIGLVGGGSLVIALLTGLVASSLGK